MTRPSRPLVLALASLATFLFLPLPLSNPARAQIPNLPEKLQADWGGTEAWPAILPGTEKLRPIQPYRAVYERVYRAGSRQDRYIWSVDDVAWDGESALAVRLVDSGNTKWADATSRVHDRYVRKDNLGLLFALYPQPGGFTDYWVVRHAPLSYSGTLVNGKGEATQVSAEKPVFEEILGRVNQRNERSGKDQLELGEDMLLFDDMTVELALGAMDLKKGSGFLLVYHDSRAGGANVRIFRVAERTTFKDKKGKAHPCWAVDSPTNIQRGEVHRYFITDRPPYFIGRQVLNLLTKKTRPYITLADYQLFKG